MDFLILSESNSTGGAPILSGKNNSFGNNPSPSPPTLLFPFHVKPHMIWDVHSLSQSVGREQVSLHTKACD